MAWKIYDYKCATCSAVARDVLTQNGEAISCETCHTDMDRTLLSVPPPITIVKGNGDYKDRERERLTLRSREHFARVGKHEARERDRMVMRKYRGLDK